MRYLITTAGSEPFFTNWFDADNNFTESVGMVVYDLCAFKYTTDGKTWKDINEDHL